MKTRVATIVFLLGLFAAVAGAETAADLHRRMEARVPDIDRLKAQLIVGEDNQGLLEIVQNGTPDAARVVADENADRKLVYAGIAAQTGSSADAVGRARARKIAANSRAGVWIQDDAGRWRKK